jgi:hypothetical protein
MLRSFRVFCNRYIFLGVNTGISEILLYVVHLRGIIMRNNDFQNIIERGFIVIIVLAVVVLSVSLWLIF